MVFFMCVDSDEKRVDTRMQEFPEKLHLFRS